MERTTAQVQDGMQLVTWCPLFWCEHMFALVRRLLERGLRGQLIHRLLTKKSRYFYSSVQRSAYASSQNYEARFKCEEESLTV